MLRSEWDAIIADIEKGVKGEGYFVQLRTKSGWGMEGGWRWVDFRGSVEIIVIDPNDGSSFYTPLTMIESVQLTTNP